METVEQLKARVRKEDAEAEAARAKQIEAVALQTRGKNEAYFEQERLREEQAKANRPISKPAQTNEEAIATAQAAYPYAPYDETAVDPLLENEPEYVQRQFNYVPLVKRPKSKAVVVVPKAPAPQYDPLKRAMPEMADILVNRPMSPQEQRIAELQQGPVLVRPTVPCKLCGDPVSPAAGYHYRANGDVCVIDEAFAKREGIIIPEKSAPKKSAKK